MIVRRFLAFFVDTLLVTVYAVLLFFLRTQVAPVRGFSYDPWVGAFTGFVSLTLPVMLYSIITESGNHRATLGKRLLGLHVLYNNPKVFASSVKRNVLKYLPWEVAHFAVHWIVFYEGNPPNYIWILAILPQMTVIGYFSFTVYTKGKTSLYDRWVGGIEMRRKEINF